MSSASSESEPSPWKKGLAGRESSWDMLRRLRMGFFAGDGPRGRLEESESMLCRRGAGDGGGLCCGAFDQSEPVCRGPYNHVTSESFNLIAGNRLEYRTLRHNKRSGVRGFISAMCDMDGQDDEIDPRAEERSMLTS